MVRAVGLYPAGSRFESWLPYHPAIRPGQAAVRPFSQTIAWICPISSACRSLVRARAAGNEASQAGIWAGVTTAQVAVRTTVGSIVTTAANTFTT